MSNFATFLKNYASGWFSPFALVQAIRGKKASSSLADYTDNYLLGKTGAGLTEAQQQTNAFTASEAQNQRAWEAEMSNTAFQRQVADMQFAGVNPALMYSSGSNGAVTPSGASAAGTSPGSPGGDVIGLLGQIANLRLLGAQRKDLLAGAKEKEANAHRAESEAKLNELKSAYQDLLNQWYPKLQQNTINQMQSVIADNYASVSERGYKIDNMQADTALKQTQNFVQQIQADWLPRLNAAKEKGDLASAASAFAEATYKGYVTQYAKEHGGVLPGPNQALGIGAAIADALASMGMSTVDLDNLDWKDLVWPWFSFFRKRD